jgi:hypothetical protein
MPKVFRQAGHNGLKTFPGENLVLHRYSPVFTGFSRKNWTENADIFDFCFVVDGLFVHLD